MTLTHVVKVGIWATRRFGLTPTLPRFFIEKLPLFVLKFAALEFERLMKGIGLRQADLYAVEFDFQRRHVCNRVVGRAPRKVRRAFQVKPIEQVG
jgi:hypothetical protein